MLHLSIEAIALTKVGGEALGGVAFIDHYTLHALAADVYVDVELWLASIGHCRLWLLRLNLWRLLKVWQ